jgi:HSP20 family protein
MAREHQRQTKSQRERQTESQRSGSEGTFSGAGGAGTAFGAEAGAGTGQGTGGSTDYTAETRQSRQGNGPGRQVARTGRRGGGLQATRGLPALLGGIPASPWELVRRMTEEMNQLFESFGGTGAGPAGTVPDRRQTQGTAPLLVPRTEVIQQPDALLVRVDMPGLAADEIEVTVEDGLLTISGERRQEDREVGEGFIRSELTYGTFFRTIQLPDGADEDNMQAVVRNGVLEIRAPIQRREQGRRVNVQPDQSDRTAALSDRGAGDAGAAGAATAGAGATGTSATGAGTSGAGATGTSERSRT